MMRKVFDRCGGYALGLMIALALTVMMADVAKAFQQPVPGATPVQAYQPLYACDQTFTATGVANTTVTATTGTQNGKYFYVCHVDITEIANAAVTGAAGPAEVCATTNLANNLTWWGDNSTFITGQMKSIITLVFGVVPVKTLAPGTAFTVVCTGGQSTYNVRVNLSGFFAS